MEGAIESFLSSPHTTLADYALVVRYIIAVWAAVQPARPQFRGSLALIDLPDTRLRPLGESIITRAAALGLAHGVQCNLHGCDSGCDLSM